MQERSQRRGQQRLEMKDDEINLRWGQQKSPYGGRTASQMAPLGPGALTPMRTGRGTGRMRRPQAENAIAGLRRVATATSSMRAQRLARRACARAPERPQRRRGHQLEVLGIVPHQLGWSNSRRRIRQTGQAAAVMVTGGATVRIECLSLAPGPCRDGGAPTTRK